MRLFEIEDKLVPCPFPNSLIKDPLYHGTAEKFSKFLRPLHGVYVTPYRDWAEDHYGTGHVVILYANITKILTLDQDTDNELIDPFYDRDYETVARNLAEWSKQGYNCCQFGGESDSMVLFNNIEMVNARTGEEM